MGNTCETKLNNLHRSVLEIQLFKNELTDCEGEHENNGLGQFTDIVIDKQNSQGAHTTNQKSIDTSFYKLASIDENV